MPFSNFISPLLQMFIFSISFQKGLHNRTNCDVSLIILLRYILWKCFYIFYFKHWNTKIVLVIVNQHNMLWAHDIIALFSTPTWLALCTRTLLFYTCEIEFAKFSAAAIFCICMYNNCYTITFHSNNKVQIAFGSYRAAI